MTQRLLGVDLGGTKIEAALVEVSADGPIVVSRARTATPRDDYAGTLAAVAALVDGFADEAEFPGVGIGTPGSWVAARRVMKNCNSTWLNERPLLTDLGSMLGMPVRMANDADCLTMSEVALQQLSGNVFGVILGTGVGGGIVCDGRLLSGPAGLSGEWGHIPLPYFHADALLPSELRAMESALADRQCYCGRMNCVETFLSGPGLEASGLQLLNESLPASVLLDQHAVHTAPVRELYCYQLARALAQIINVLDPHAIVLGGGVSNAAVLYDRVPQLLARYVFSGEHATCLYSPVGGDSSGVVGAALLWQQKTASG